MRVRVVQDLEHLETHAYGLRMTTWWGTLAFFGIEGMALALAAGSYLYLAWLSPVWPLSAPPPDLLWSSLFTLVLLLSLIPTSLLMRIAHTEDLVKVRILLIIMTLVGILACGLRVMEFTTLHVRWDTNAYGSLVWFILALHTTHIVTDVIDTAVLTVMMFTRHAKGKRFSDAEDDGLYWYFVIIVWLPIYGLLYWFPRFWGGN